MKPRTIKTVYWIATVIFALLAIMDGIGGVTRQQDGIDVMNRLGYPVYFLSIIGIAKLLGAAAILQTRYRILKEWAFAGFTFNFLGAFASQSLAGGSTFEVVFPIIVLGIMLVPYLFWKKYEQVRYAIA